MCWSILTTNETSIGGVLTCRLWMISQLKILKSHRSHSKPSRPKSQLATVSQVGLKKQLATATDLLPFRKVSYKSGFVFLKPGRILNDWFVCVKFCLFSASTFCPVRTRVQCDQIVLLLKCFGYKFFNNNSANFWQPFVGCEEGTF